MRHPQVIVYERDGRLATLLRAQAQQRRWALHEPRRLENTLQLLRGAGPSVLVVKIGSQLEQELTLLERAHWLAPSTRTIAVSDVENEALENLAWDLGVHYALFPPQSRQVLADVVVSLMEAALGELAPEPANAAPHDLLAESEKRP